METGALTDAESEADVVLRISPQYQPARDLKNAITFLAKRERQTAIPEETDKGLGTGGSFGLSVFSSPPNWVSCGVFCHRKRPPALWIDTTLEDPANE